MIREKRKDKNIPCVNAAITIPEGCTAIGLMEQPGLEENEARTLCTVNYGLQSEE
jgi:hypothetical protein